VRAARCIHESGGARGEWWNRSITPQRQLEKKEPIGCEQNRGARGFAAIRLQYDGAIQKWHTLQRDRADSFDHP